MDSDIKAYKEVEREREKARSVMFNVLVGAIILFLFILFFGRSFYNEFYVESGCVSQGETYINPGDGLTYLKSTNLPFNGFICGYRGDSRFVNGKKEGPHSGYWQNEDYPNDFRRWVSLNWLFSHSKMYTNYYSNDLLNGRCETFDINGNLISFANYANGKLNGEKGSMTNGRWAYVNYKDGKLIKNNISNDEVESQNESIAPLPKPKPITSETYVILIGIEQYKNGYVRINNIDPSGYFVKNLSHCKDDCYMMKEFLKSKKGGAVLDENIIMLLDGKAYKQNILKSINKIVEKADINDRIIIYFAGHGSGNELMTYEYDKFQYNSLSIGLIDTYLRQSKAKHKLLIADACIGPMPMGSNGRGAAEEFNNSLSEFEPSFLHLRSCSKNETAWESSRYGQGIFSYWLLKGLEGEADLNNDLKVTISELFKFVKESVSYDVLVQASEIQTPQIKGKVNPYMPMSTLK